MKLIKIAVLILSIPVVFDCSNKKPENKKEQILFNVEQSLLDSIYTNSELEITFSPPKNWNPISIELMESIAANTEILSDSIRIKLQKVFMNKDISAFCFVSKLEGNYPNPKLIENYIQVIKKKNAGKSINKASFDHHNFKIEQLMIFDRENINLKLIVRSQEQKNFLLDYIIPMKFYEDNLRVIESSIGSLSQINR